jgi:hypothetical protein
VQDQNEQPASQGLDPAVGPEPSARTPQQRARAQEIRRDIQRCLSMDLNLLRAFVCVADVRSVGVAATHLGQSPSALDQRLKALEQHLGYRLLLRTQAGVRLTEHGGELLPYLRVVLGTVEALRKQATSEPTTSEPTTQPDPDEDPRTE